jgi:hypothetical protein
MTPSPLCQTEVLVIGDAVVTVTDSCFINGTYDSAIFTKGTPFPQTDMESNYMDMTTRTTKCSGLFWEVSANTCLDSGVCGGECYPFGSDSCRANQPTPSPSASPTMLASASPTSINGGGVLSNFSSPTTGGAGTLGTDSSGAHSSSVPSTFCHFLYHVLALALWTTVIHIDWP